MKNFFDQLCAPISTSNQLIYIDIGAMGGVCVYWKQLAHHAHIIAFEPDEREFAKVKSNAGITYLPYALYHSSQALRFYVSRDSGKSSIYQPNEHCLNDFPHQERYATVKEINFPKEKVRTLDEVLASKGFNDIDFMKIDTQGSELDILKGARVGLEHMFGVEVEVEFASLYKGQPLFRDIDAFLDAQGFCLMDLRRCLWKRSGFSDYIGRGQLIFGDALYFRRADIFLGILAKYPDTSCWTDKIRKAVAVCMVYKMADYAVDLLDKALAKAMINGSLHETLVSLIKQEARSWGMPHLWGRGMMAKVFNRLAETIKLPSHLGWADGDRFIGNTRNL